MTPINGLANIHNHGGRCSGGQAEVKVDEEKCKAVASTMPVAR